MTRNQRRVRLRWLISVTRAIKSGAADPAYKLTVAYVRRLRRLGVL